MFITTTVVVLISKPFTYTDSFYYLFQIRLTTVSNQNIFSDSFYYFVESWLFRTLTPFECLF